MPSTRSVQIAFANVAASQTDQVLVPAQTGMRVRVLALTINQGDTTSSTVVFNSKGSGAGTAISPTLKYAPNGGVVLPDNDGWFQTNVGEGLSVTTGAGSATGVLVTYQQVPDFGQMRSGMSLS